MAFRPIATDKIRDGRRLRILAAPQFIRPDGRQWRKIGDVVTVRKATGYGYYIPLPGGEWIRLVLTQASQREALLAARDSETLDRSGFGPRLRPQDAPDSLEWQLTCSSGVRQVSAERWIGYDADGVQLGLDLRDWRRTLGDKLTISGNRITMDLTAAKQRGRIIDLDPAVDFSNSSPLESIGMDQSDAENGWDYVTLWSGQNLWAVMGAASAGSYTDGRDMAAFRSYLRFDTTGLGEVSAATLTLYMGAFQNDPLSGDPLTTAKVRLFKANADYGTLSAADWGVADTAVGAEQDVSAVATDGAVTWDVTSHVDSVNHTCFILKESTYDAGSANVIETSDGAQFHKASHATYPPMLEVTLAGGSLAARTLLGVGR